MPDANPPRIQPPAVPVHRTYRWVPDVPDRRDFRFEATFKPSTLATQLPETVDLREKMSTVEDQGSLGSCTANALVGSLECLEGIKKQAMIDLSRLFVYYNERVIEGTVRIDAGAMLRDGIKTLAKQGVCSEKTWPYDIKKFGLKPPPQAYQEATQRKIKSYHRLETLKDMKTCLASGYPFVFGFAVYSSFTSEDVAKTGVVPMPKDGEKYLGGHAVCAVGYDDRTGRSIVRNSWGTGWGMKGYFTMPYDYLVDRYLSDDFWTIQS